MSYEWLVARRYIWSKRRHPFVGVMSTISVLGICVGVAALIVVLAVMNGFDEDLRDRIIGMRAHLVIEKDKGIDEPVAVMEKLDENPLVAGSAPFVEGQALLQKGESASGVLVRGIDVERERSVSKFFDYVTKGALTEKADGVVLGSELAKRFGLAIGSEVQLLTQNAKKPAAFKVEGLFTSGFYEYDANLVFLNIKSAQTLFDLKASAAGISVALREAGLAARAKREIQETFGPPYTVRTWMDMNKTLFGALKLEKLVMFLILALIILVACLNIAGSLTIMVMDKTKDIGVLKVLGATPWGLVKIFALNGLVIGFLGAAFGWAIGTGLCYLLKNTKLVELPKEIYYLDRLPVKMDLQDTAVVFAVAVGLSFFSALYPAIMAGRFDPVKALRYE